MLWLAFIDSAVNVNLIYVYLNSRGVWTIFLFSFLVCSYLGEVGHCNTLVQVRLFRILEVSGHFFYVMTCVRSGWGECSQHNLLGACRLSTGKMRSVDGYWTVLCWVASFGFQYLLDKFIYILLWNMFCSCCIDWLISTISSCYCKAGVMHVFIDCMMHLFIVQVSCVFVSRFLIGCHEKDLCQ